MVVSTTDYEIRLMTIFTLMTTFTTLQHDALIKA